MSREFDFRKTYLCIRCKSELTPNPMEGGWAHFDQRGCPLAGRFGDYLSTEGIEKADQR